MNYGELRQAILDDTHRADLSAHVPRFVRQAEGLMRRQLTGYALSAVLGDSDRVTPGGNVYTLPAYTVQVRAVQLVGEDGDSLEQMSIAGLRRMLTTAPPLWYGLRAGRLMEIRGTPTENAEFDLEYFGHPAPLVDDADANNLLTDHETLYLAGSSLFLYQHTQDRELANDAGVLFNAIIDDLNEAYAREHGGATVAPTYNFSGGSSY